MSSVQPSINETTPRFDVRGGLVVLFVCLIVQIIVRICRADDVGMQMTKVAFADAWLWFALAKSFSYCQQRFNFSFLLKTVRQYLIFTLIFAFTGYWMIWLPFAFASPMYYVVEPGLHGVIFCCWMLYFCLRFKGYLRRGFPVLLMGITILGYMITFNNFSYPSEANFHRNFSKYNAVVEMVESGKLKPKKYYPVSKNDKTYQRGSLNLPCEYSYLVACSSYVEKLDNITEIYFCTMNSISVVFRGFVYRSDDYDLTLNNEPGGVYGYQYKKLREHWFYLNYER